MKIAVLAPSPVPFVIGGVEHVSWALCEAINNLTQHEAELIKYPSKEHNFWDLIDSYRFFYNLDLDHFDMVITMKYPCWMIHHRNLICWTFHCLRGLYDTYQQMNLPYEVKGGNKYIDSILTGIRKNPTPDNLESFFSALNSLRENADSIPNDYFAFPGPFIRMLVHYMDGYGLRIGKVKRYYSLSHTVKNRKDYFPKNAEVKVVYSPPKYKRYSYGDYKHLFIVSRLDDPKRIDILIDAMKFVKSDIPLFIAGKGPAEERLKKKAEKDGRIIFLGFVTDEIVDQYYANALVVPYFPYDEDYGLVTVEAMLHKKPVITTSDSGGPTEFVVNGETGFCVNLNSREIGEKIQYFVDNKDIAKKMGNQGHDIISSITWQKTVASLLDENPSATKARRTLDKRYKITATTTYPIYPPRGGGQSRLYNLYRALAEYYDIEMVSLANSDQAPFDQTIAPNYREIRVPKSKKHQEREWKMEQKAGIPISDIGAISLYSYTTNYVEALKESVATSDIIIMEHPYLFFAVQAISSGKPIIYGSHNVESHMKEEMLPDSSVKKRLVKSVFDVEREACVVSDGVFTCSNEDILHLSKLYDISSDKMIVVPNGVDTESTFYVAIEERLTNKRHLGLGHVKIGLFIGSWHQPNLDACEMIFSFASKCPETIFLLMGSQCLYFKDRRLPDNVGLLGVVDDQIKNKVMATVDFALNPMLSGSGTNLKMFDYMSAGIPVITTLFGTRGIEDKSAFIIAEPEEMAQAINSFDLTANEARIRKNRKYVEEYFDWKVIAQQARKMIDQIIAKITP